jgi:hypothetical protein
VVVSSSIDNPTSGKEHRTEADHIVNVIKMKPKGGIKYEGKLCNTNGRCKQTDNIGKRK